MCTLAPPGPPDASPRMPAAARLPPRRPALLGLQILTSSSDRRRARLWEGSGVSVNVPGSQKVWNVIGSEFESLPALQNNRAAFDGYISRSR